MKKAVRTMSFAKRDAHAAPLFKEFKILNFPKLIELHLGKLQWVLHNGIYPKFLKNNLLTENISRADRQRTINQKFTPLTRTKYKANFTSSKGQICWRDIPDNIKLSKTKKSFYTKFRKHLYNQDT